MGVIDLVAEDGGEAEELVGWDVGEFAGSEFVFDGVVEFGESVEVGVVGGEDFFINGFAFEAAEVANFFGVDAVPVEECVFGDAEVGGDAGDAPALGADLDELVSGFVGVHKGVE